ncbi:thiamine pyrophosphate-dependent enzyme [Kordiimonas sp.]|uniref:thiamine pyrophosphate-dependent enzyme n=1 Tax=Kordiimonas sp. TaxID=1970157 RepID=UPI003A8DDAD4
MEAPAQPAVCHGAPETYSGAEQLNTTSISAILGELLPERTIVSDESATAGQAIFSQTQKAAKHDWLTLTGGSIGQGLPVAIGVAVACPNNKVIALQGDGGAMYTVQALWTMAREALDITTIILNNSSYAILNIELQRVGVSDPGEMALAMLDHTNPKRSTSK